MLPDHVLEKQIIIVGAGISGITCAEKLLNYNFKNVKVLEASYRLGGRLCTYNCSGREATTARNSNHVEMGAQRVPADSSVYKLAMDLNHIDATAPDYSEALENFKLVYDKNECLAIANLRVYLSRRVCFPIEFDGILKDKEFWKLFEKTEGHLIEYMQNYMKGVYQWWHGMSYEYTFKNKQAELTAGYSGLLQKVVDNLPKDLVVLRKEVIKIDWGDFQNVIPKDKSTGDPMIKIHCRDESVYEADHVIITIPLGHLKETYQTLFVPSLSEDKIKAIQDLNFTTVDKIFLEFRDPFWGVSDVYHVIWNEKMDNLFNEHMHDSGQDTKTWIKCINRFEYVHTNPYVLCAWIWGEGAIIMESLPEEEVSCCCMILLQHLTKKSLPKPNNLFRSKWFSDPLFRGSLVYDPSQGVRHKIAKMAESVCLKGDQLILQFAGDATYDFGQMSSVHGARESGLRAAKELYMHSAVKAGIVVYDSNSDTDSDDVVPLEPI